MRNIEAELSELLRDEIDGPHGESERRAAAEFVRDAMSGNDYDDPVEAAAGLAESLAAACGALAKQIRDKLIGPALFERVDAGAEEQVRSLAQWWDGSDLTRKDKIFVVTGMVYSGHLVCLGDGPDFRAGDHAALRAQVTALLPTLPHDPLCNGRGGKPCDCYKAEMARHVEEAAASAALDAAEENAS